MKDINKIFKLRELMDKENLDCYMVVDSDNHSSEYVNDYYREMTYMSEFLGGEGLLVVLKNKACLFTDGRYEVEAKGELDFNVFELCVYPERLVDSVVSYLKENNVNNVGLNGERFSTSFVEKIKEIVNVNAQLDFIKEIYKERKSLEFSKIFNISEYNKYSYKEKIEKVRSMLYGKSLLLSDLTDIAWLFNIRGFDIETSLLFLSFSYISKDEVHLFINEKSLDFKLEGIIIHDYSEFVPFIKTINNENILIDKSSLNYLYFEILNKTNKLESGYTPTTLLKCVKDDIEIESTRQVHIADGLAVFRMMKYLNEHDGLDELKVCDKILEFRKMDKRFITVSFDTIAGFNENGAIVHYSPSIETNLEINRDGLLLLDSGGQYYGGTTDITRTFAVGNVSEEMKEYYTLVLKGHIDVSKLVFEKNTLGKDIDMVSRHNFLDRGLDYKHGTGHGVGFMNNVHEGPVRLSLYGAKTDEHSYVIPGLVTSIEPGIYLENKFGIRIENEIFCKEVDGKLSYETITYCPYDLRLIKKEMLDNEELKWLNDYHKMVRELLSPLCTFEEKKYLDEVTREL